MLDENNTIEEGLSAEAKAAHAEQAAKEVDLPTENVKTLQQLIQEKFDTGEGDQVLNITVAGVNSENIEVLIAGRRYSVVGDTLFLVEQRTENTGEAGRDDQGAPVEDTPAEQQGQQAQADTNAEPSGTDTAADAAGAGQADTALSGSVEGTAEAENVTHAEHVVGSGDGITGDGEAVESAPTGGDDTAAGVDVADDPTVNPTLKEVMQFFGADDVRQNGEAIKDGADIYDLLSSGQVLVTGTLAELEGEKINRQNQANTSQA